MVIKVGNKVIRPDRRTEKQIEDRDAMLKRPVFLTCPNCGFTGNDVHYHFEHVGGEGNKMVLGCDDRKICWQRYNKQNFSDEGWSLENK